MKKLSIQRVGYKSYVDFGQLGGWASLTPLLFKGQLYT